MENVSFSEENDPYARTAGFFVFGDDPAAVALAAPRNSSRNNAEYAADVS
jgi:hypothetical protein